MAEITGIGVSPGQAVGPVVCLPNPIVEPSPDTGSSERADPAALVERIAAASARVRDELSARAAKAHGDRKAILEATALMVVDPMLFDAARQKVSALLSPARAVWEAAAEVAAGLTSRGGYLAERALAERARDVDDVRDPSWQSSPGCPCLASPTGRNRTSWPLRTSPRPTPRYWTRPPALRW